MITLEIAHLRYREDCPTPSLQPSSPAEECARPADIAYCRIGGAETPLTHIDGTHASCRVPAQAREMAAPVTLRTLSELYFGGHGYRPAATLYYTEETGIHAMDPPEGPAEGDQVAKVVGNFTALGQDQLSVAFDGVP